MASLVSEKKYHQLQGGYECIFVSDPPKILQTECSICLCVLREPYLVDCECGNSFCKTCIEPIKSDQRPCPLCNIQFTTAMPNRRLSQRTLNELQVYCCHKEGGCEWVGELGSLPQHLNLLNSGNRFSGCQLAKLACEFCGDAIQRKDLEEHEGDKCMVRPYSCEHCEKYESTFEDVMANHWPTCPSRPVPCPNECGTSPELQFLDCHIDNECPLQVIECAFKYAGCKQTCLRKDMADHITHNLAIHISLQAASHQEELKKLNARISELEIQLDNARAENQKLLRRVEQQDCSAQVAVASREIKKAQDQRLKGHLNTLRGEIKKAQNETKQEIMKQMESEMAVVHNHVGLVPVCFTMPDFQHKKSSNSSWFSPSFYTHSRGYKLCVNVDANGYGSGQNSHISVFLFLMLGEYDESPKWPFQGDITVRLLNQLGDCGHNAMTLPVTDHIMRARVHGL